jgi:hypothetical protein
MPNKNASGNRVFSFFCRYLVRLIFAWSCRVQRQAAATLPILSTSISIIGIKIFRVQRHPGFLVRIPDA